MKVEHVSGPIVSNIIQFASIVWQVSDLSKYIVSNIRPTCFHLILSFFKKMKRGLELVSLPHFPHNFWRKIFLLLCFINWSSFIVCLSLPCYFVRYWEICVLELFCKPGCDVMNFEVNLLFLIKLFFLDNQNVVTKM